MKIEEKTVNDTATLKLHGKMKRGENDELLHEKVKNLVEAGTLDIVLDLEDVPYADSSGLGEVARCYVTVTRQGGKLKLVNLSRGVHELLRITHLLPYFVDE